MYLRLSKLRYAASLGKLNALKNANLTKEQLVLFADCSYINRAENILITGATGCGKPYLACALGHQACLLGYKTLYLNMTRFVEKLSVAKIEGSVIKVYKLN